MLVSRLRGLSIFYESTDSLGLATPELDQIIDTLNCLQLVGHTMLINANGELPQFTAFSTWLKQEIEIQGIDMSSPAANEIADKDRCLDYHKILDYIQGPMVQSRLIELLGLHPESDIRSSWDLPGEILPIYSRYKADLRIFVKGDQVEKKLPGLDLLVSRLDRQCRSVFERIAETQKRKAQFGEPILLGRPQIQCLDMRMLFEVSKLYNWSRLKLSIIRSKLICSTKVPHTLL